MKEIYEDDVFWDKQLRKMQRTKRILMAAVIIQALAVCISIAAAVRD